MTDPLAAARDRLVLALDLDLPDDALAVAAALRGDLLWVKVATRLFTRAGPALVRDLRDLGLRVFLDLKFHDIPDQVEGACRSSAALGASLVTVHASGGRAMLEAAARGAREGAIKGEEPPRVLAVTVLTSLDAADLRDAGVTRGTGAQAAALAVLAREAGCGGVVASPLELPLLRPLLPAPFRILTPGIRPAGASVADQKRTATPAAAVRQGADWLVVGRPILRAADPAAAVRSVLSEIAATPGPGPA